MTWAAFTMALVGLALWACLIAVLIGVYGKARPYVQAYAPMISAMMPTAAGTGGIGEPAGSSPAAFPDQCEYDEHIWSVPGEPERGEHYCKACGYIESLPGA